MYNNKYKYIFKGPDMAALKLSLPQNNQETHENQKMKYNEITQFLNARYLCPPEARWRIWEYSMHGMSHVVY